MDNSLVQAFAALLLTYALWRGVRALTVKSSLHHIPGPPSPSWSAGNLGQIFNKNGWAFRRELRKKYGGVAKIKGEFGISCKPLLSGRQILISYKNDFLYVWDPLALHNILVKDQYSFEETKAFLETNRLTVGKSLLSTHGEKHKKQRKMLNPVFTSKHMRDMLPMLYPIAHQANGLSHDVRSGKEHIDVMSWVSRGALEYIGQGGLGYSFSALDKEKKTNSYSDALKMFFPLLFRLFFVQRFSHLLVKLGSPQFRKRILDFIPFKLVNELREVTDILETSSRSILREKREAIKRGDEAVLAQVGKGKDIMSILLKANTEADLPESELLGHMSTFILAGHDTTTSAVSRILHLLALNPDLQSKLREEVTAARKEYGDLDYDALQALPYLDAVCRETMRAYPPASPIERVTAKDVILPLKWPIKSVDGKTEIKEILVPKNTGIIVSILGANLSTKIWGDDAEEWKPDRWLKPLPESVADAHLPGVYSQMMTFLGGGRACIGFKFSEMEMKMVLSILLETFIFGPGPNVFWEFGFISTPIAEGTKDGMPRLPLKVSLVKN
ncbi:hypothetical protein M0805_000624 [Coniferiporia weirii]|nr:hypothetical protein M0805_000624 [Coniferiporia weirii]